MINKGGYKYGNLCKIIRPYVGGRNILSCWVKTFLLLFVITFVWVQVVFGNFFWIKNDSHFKEQPNNYEKKIDNIKDSLQYHTQVGKLIKSIKNGDQYEEQTNNKNGATEIRERISQYNEEQKVINEEIHGPLSNDSLVIVVQVHNRINYLKYLIDSLSKAENIGDVLLIFSHDIFDDNINKLIQNITFCKVMQIFFPYSVEANPDEFPGNDPKDCPRDIGKKSALRTKCLGAETPDKYGHYRESKFTQIKHHWWWKANRVFTHLKITKAFTGLVIFLEEDHYVAEDFFTVIKMMDQKCDETEGCYFLGLANHIKLQVYKFKDSDKVKMSTFITNLGLTFNRSTFNKLLDCSKQFCEYDDYNWDWSLNHVVQDCNAETILKSMIAVAPRVFHTGECGIHVHKRDCNGEDTISKIRDLLNNAKNQLYPSSISVQDSFPRRLPMKENGGWGDKRDHELCINMTKR